MRVMDCSECGGTGAAKGHKPDRRIPNVTAQAFKQFLSVLRSVWWALNAPVRRGGKGKIYRRPCHKCNGKGKVRTRKKIEVNIPAGIIDNNQIVNVRGFGNAGSNGGPSGDPRLLSVLKSIRISTVTAMMYGL